MRRILLSAFTILLSVSMFGIGRGDGSTKANAIDFDWANGNVYEASASPRWYRVDLSPLYEEENPTLALYLTNLESQDANVHLVATLLGETESRSYVIAGNQNRVWSVAASMLIKTKQTEVFLTLQSDRKAALSAKVYAGGDVDESCKDAKLFDWSAVNVQLAGEQWYKVDLAAAKASGKQIEVRVTNTAGKTATVLGSLSMDCPSTGVTDYTLTLAAGETRTKVLARTTIDMLSPDEVYVRVTTTQPLQLSAVLVDVPSTPVIDNCTEAIEALLGQEYSIAAGTYLYKIKPSALRGIKQQPELTLTNNGSAVAQIKGEVAFECPATTVLEKNISLGAGTTTIKEIQKNLIDAIDENVEYVYVRLTTSEPLTFSGRLKGVHEGDACKTATTFDWTKGNLQMGGTTTWYAVDITEAKDYQKNIIVRLLNKGNKSAVVTAQVAFDCPYTDVQSITRTVAAGELREKVIDYALFGMLATNTIYVGLTTTEQVQLSASLVDAPIHEEDDACLNAIPFDWTYGHKQNAKDTVWYKVGVRDIMGTTLLPTVVIRNMGAKNATINGQMSIECPDVVANTERTLTIAAGATYQKQIARDMINGIDTTFIDTLYFRVVSSEAIAFEVKMTQEDEGGSCRSAVLFNWVSGNEHAAGASVWYMVDLKAAKAAKKDIRLTVVNKANTTNTAVAGVALNCPCDAPQTQKATFRAGETKTKTLPYSLLETMGDSVYVRLHATGALHIEAALVDPEPFDEIVCPDSPVAFNWGNTYHQTQDTVWYYLSKTVLDSLNKTYMTPRLHLTNGAQAQSIMANVAYHCPITSAMMSKSVSVAAGQDLYKLIERATAEQMIADKDTILVQLIAGAPFSFSAELVDPNTGDDCVHAVNVEYDHSYVQEAGTTLWYRFDLNATRALDKMITFAMQNIDGRSGRVTVSAYMSCDSASLYTRATTIGANASISRNFASDVFAGLAGDYLFLEITAAQQLSLSTTLSDHDPITPITACNEAMAAVPNQDYVQVAGEQWYVINMADLRANTAGDGTLRVYNQEAAEATTKVELSWVCPVEHAMTGKTRVIAASDSVITMLSRSTINSTQDSLAYIRVTTDKQIRFRLDLTLSRGDECDNAILFDWVNGHIHPAGKYLWYQVRLDSTIIPVDKDMRLYIENLDKADSATANADIYFDCNEAKTHTLSYDFIPGETASRIIDRDLLVNMGWADMLINYTSDHNTKIYAELVPAEPQAYDYDTIRAIVCDGENYTDSITGEIHTILSTDRASWTWNDTVGYRSGTTYRDSVTTFIIRPRVTVRELTSADLQAINAMPLLVQGMRPSLTPSLNAIKAYYAGLESDTMAQINQIYWATKSESQYVAVDTTQYIAKGTDTYALYLVVEDACDNELHTSFTFMTGAWKYASVMQHDTVCPGTASALYPTAAVTRDTIITDTIKNVLITDTLGMDRLMDTVKVMDIKVYKAPVLYTDLTVQPIVRQGRAINTTNATTALQTRFTNDKDDLTMDVTTVSWERKDLTSGAYEPVSAAHVGKEEANVILRYVVATSCGQILISQDFSFTPEAYTYVTRDVSDRICAGETYQGRMSSVLVLNDTTWSDTVTVTTATATFDSIYHYSLQALKTQYAAKETKRVCEGESLTWHGLTLTATGNYTAKEQYVGTSCDSMVYEIDFTVLTTARETEIATLCEGDSYTWVRDGKTYSAADAAKTIEYAEKYADSTCDSVIYTLKLKVLSVTKMPAETETICEGKSLEWHGQTLTVAGTYTATEKYADTDCDSVEYTLTLTTKSCLVRVETAISDTVCEGTEYIGRLTTHTITGETTWTDSVRVEVDGTDTDSIYHYVVRAYLQPMPAIDGTMLQAVCGKAVNVDAATRAVVDFIAAEPLYAPAAHVAWEIEENGAWTPLSDAAIAGGVTAVKVRCSVTSDCGVTFSDAISLVVEQPNADNDSTMNNIPASSKYNGSLLMLNLNAIREQFGWEVASEDVTWYKQKEATPNTAIDELVQQGGYYYTIGSALTGTYYAQIAHTATAADECSATLRTEVLTCTGAKLAPQLLPSVARPQEKLHIVNLDPETETIIRVYSTSGELLGVYTSQASTEYVLEAANYTGYYMVEVETEAEKVTLRYIVK